MTCDSARGSLARRAAISLGIAFALLLAGCGSREVSAAKPPTPLTVGVVRVIQKDVPVYGDWVATLDGYINANIQPQVTGYLVKQDYSEGSLVRKNQVLFEIDPRPFEAALQQAQGQVAQARGQLAEAQAQLGLAKINVRRDTPLAQAQAIAQSQLDNDIQTEAQDEAIIKADEALIASNLANVKQAELNLGFTKVRSLVDGIAGIAATQIGNLVSPSITLTSVSQVNPIKVYFPISEQEYLSLAGGPAAGSRVDLLRRGNQSPLEMTLANGEKYPHPGSIIFADRQVNTQTGTIRIVGQFPNPGNLLRPGQFGRIRAMTSFHRGALLVPQRAVTELQGGYQVAVVGGDNKVLVRTVQVGERIGPMWIVTAGLKAGDQVVADGSSKVREGMTVTPKPEAPAGEAS